MYPEDRIDLRHKQVIAGLMSIAAAASKVKPVDLASIDIHTQACLTSLILLLRCRQRGGHGPLPRLVGLSRFPPCCGCGFEMKMDRAQVD
jgi:hypothetical protein